MISPSLQPTVQVKRARTDPAWLGYLHAVLVGDLP